LSVRQTRVLVVDDIRLNQRMLERILKYHGWQCDLAENGLEAVNLVKSNPSRYRIVLMDNAMPVMDGTQAMHELHALASSSSAPDSKSESTASDTKRALFPCLFIVVVTADALVGSKKRFLNEGFDAYASKPITIKSIELALRAGAIALAKSGEAV
jgi:CheY-like chemotaxis protein